jgi:hypothetical protein
MTSESLIVGLVVLLLCGAVSFYVYVRLMFLEKKVTVMESILVDVRVALDSIMMEHSAHHALPISHTPGAQLSAPAPLDPSEAENIPEEKFYSSVLEQAHDKQEDGDGSGNGSGNGSGAEGAAEGLTAEAALKSFDEAEAAPPAVAAPVGPNLDSMTRQELATLAEKNGLRVKRNMNRAEVLALLRRSNPAQNDLTTTGTENVSGSTGTPGQTASSLDGSTTVDLGNGVASLD